MSYVPSPDDASKSERGGSGSSPGLEKPRPKAKPMAMMGMGLEYGAVMAVFCLAGWWLDSRLGTSPWLMLVLVTIAMIGGMYKLWRFGKRYFE